MVKVWRDLSEMEATHLPTKLEEYKREMESVPRFDKLAGGRKIYQRKEYSIYKVSDGFVIHNTSVKFEEGHTHLRSFTMAKTIIDNAITKKLPKTRNKYLLISTMRISTDAKYIDEIEKLIDVRESKQNLKYVIKR